MKTTRLPILLLSALALPLHAQNTLEPDFAAIPATPGFPANTDSSNAAEALALDDAPSADIFYAGAATVADDSDSDSDSEDATVGVAGGLAGPVILQMAEQAVLTEPGPRAFLGLATTKPSRDLADHLGIPKNTGLAIATVSPDSPAAKAGLQQGDVITRLDDQILVNAEQMLVLVTNRKKGDVVKVSFFRHGEAKTVDATLAEREGGEGIQPWGQAAPRFGMGGNVTFGSPTQGFGGGVGFGGNTVPGISPGPGTTSGTSGVAGGASYSFGGGGEPGKPLRTIIRRLKFDGKQAQADAETALAEIRKQLESKETQAAIAEEVSKVAEKSKDTREKIEKELRELTERLKALEHDSAEEK